MEAVSRRDRIIGALMGLAAGDKNGGPMRMALRLGESLVERNELDMFDVVQRYHKWFRGPPYDVEKAFDSGPTWAKVFRPYKEGEDIGTLYATSRQVSSCGVNSCHRALPLACCGFLSEADLIAAVKKEGTLTHSNPIAVDSTVAFVLICRALIEGKSLEEGIRHAKKHVESLEVRNVLVTEFSFSGCYGAGNLYGTGVASETLFDSIYFVLNGNNFSDILQDSITFAGAANYCPVLVGAWAGAIYGIDGIPPELIGHDMDHLRGRTVPVEDRLRTLASKLVDTWEEKPLSTL